MIPINAKDCWLRLLNIGKAGPLALVPRLNLFAFRLIGSHDLLGGLAIHHRSFQPESAESTIHASCRGVSLQRLIEHEP